jgi:chromosome segregation ATPase
MGFYPASGTSMGSSIFETALYVLGGGILGALCGWLVQAMIGKRRLEQVTNAALTKLDAVTVQRDRYANKYSRSRESIQSLQAALAKRSTEFKSVLKKAKLLTRNVVTLRTERENTKIKLSTMQKALGSLKQQTTALQSEFEKTQSLFKRELLRSFEKRKQLETEVQEARAEQESFANLVESSTLEHGSTENMIIAAQLRLGQLQVLERNVSKLEAENTQLNRDIVRIRQEFAAQERSLAELEELRIHNKQLVRCVEALEGSRKEYETDAERYREQADQSEKLSDTLRLKLDDLEKNFEDIEKQQGRALKDARKAAVVPMLRNQG